MRARLQKRIFALLSRCGTFHASEYPKVLRAAKRDGRDLLEQLVHEGRVTEEEVARCVAKACGLEFQRVHGDVLSKELASEVPSVVALTNRVIPVGREGDALVVAVSEPVEDSVVEDLARTSECFVEVRVATRSSVDQGLKRLYGGAVADRMVADSLPPASAYEDDSDAVVEILDDLLEEAARKGASDIHIEPEQARVRIRLRIDGVLHLHSYLPKSLRSALVSRAKVLAGIDVVDKRLPQDGSFTLNFKGSPIDVRVSTIPSIHGERAAMRLLTSREDFIVLDDLGMEEETLEQYRRFLKRPNGIILLTGPTGSGKTTTLYASLTVLRSPEINVLTVEEPVEYYLEGITQTQVNRAIGLGFSESLRALLHQDPDVIMVGEIRDRQTADIALRAALTGHLVFSTLHTNDAPGGLTRLLDIGCEPYLVCSSVRAIVAQRLLRLNCEACRYAFKPSEELVRSLGLDDPGRPRQWYRADGCDECYNTGYRGRTGVFELLPMDDEVRRMVVAHRPTDEIRDLVTSRGMTTLRLDCLRKLERGLTTPEEVIRVTSAEQTDPS